MNRVGYLAVLALFLIGCGSFIPKIKVPLRDLHGVPFYTIKYKCTGVEDSRVVKCVGGIKDGVFYCDKNNKYFKCEKGDKKLFYAFDADSMADLASYIKYLEESYNE